MSTSWPILRRFDQKHLLRVAMPIGGIGTGTVSIGGRGDLRDWEIMNQPCKHFTPRHTFFAIRAQVARGEAMTRALEGATDPAEYAGSHGCRVPNSSLPRFRRCEFAAAYPLAQVMLRDRDMPLDVRVEAFNPLIPGDDAASGIPIAIVRFVLMNKTRRRVSASICGNLENFIGRDGIAGASKQNVNEFRVARPPGRDPAAARAAASGIFMRSEGVDPDDERWGTIALATTASQGLSHRVRWPDLSWGDALLDFWDDFSADGVVEHREMRADVASDSPMASLAVSTELPPRQEKRITFLLAWHFPNRMSWNKPPAEQVVQLGKPPDNRVGNFYATQYADAWDVIERTAPRLRELEDRTVEFVRAVVESDTADVIKEAALSNLSTLRSQTAYRIEDGTLCGWEGCGDLRQPTDKGGCCHGSCTHVWNYEQATAFLFGSLSCTMRRLEFLHATRDDGHMAFRIALPPGREQDWQFAAADGQMGCLIKLYRDWQLSGDESLLHQLWPRARAAMEFCWIDGGWDGDRDGVMEGCQHNTMDVEYFGPNPHMSVMYLAALRAMEEMAGHLGEERFARTCRQLFESGRQKIDAELFNGDYYQQHIVPIPDPSRIAPGLRTLPDHHLPDPPLQIGPGCEVNQLFGQQLANVAGLGHLLDRRKMHLALRAMVKHNFRDGFTDFFNHLRTYSLNDESGLLMCTWPRGGRPKRPFPYANEVWTGLEYMVAAHLLDEGMTREAVRLITAARDRHDGLRRNPFNEFECGNHYARAMSSWAMLIAATGFHYSAVEQSMVFAPIDGKVFWSSGYAWGTCEQRLRRKRATVTISVLGGKLRLRWLTLRGRGSVELPHPVTIARGASQTLQVELRS